MDRFNPAIGPVKKPWPVRTDSPCAAQAALRRHRARARRPQRSVHRAAHRSRRHCRRYHRITGHSGRVGPASKLTARGVSTTETMLAGGWKTARMVAHYSAVQPPSRMSRPHLVVRLQPERLHLGPHARGAQRLAAAASVGIACSASAVGCQAAGAKTVSPVATPATSRRQACSLTAGCLAHQP